MTARQPDQAAVREPTKSPAKGKTEDRRTPGQVSGATKPSEPSEQRDSGLPGGGQGRVDHTGVVPEGVRVDPNVTEGHPGYDESGPSEIVPRERAAGGESGAEGGQAG